jgi:malate synthase
VDAEDKVVAYSNWLGLMKGDIAVPMQKGASAWGDTSGAGMWRL